MSLLAGLWTGLQDAFGMGLSAVQTKMNYDINQQNYNLARDNYQFTKDSYLNNFEYQKNLQQQIFGREDNAVQRRAADLQKAGLSKTLAAGDGAGAGTAISTSPFTGSAPQRSPVDLISAGMNMAQGLSDIRKVQAETENALKQNKVMDSQLLNDEYQRNYILAKTALEWGNVDMLGMTWKEKSAAIALYNKQIDRLNEEIEASIQNRAVNNYKLTVLLPQQFQKGVEEIANLKKQGLIYDADLKYRNMQSDLLVYDINNALFSSRIKELDYYYQVNTGLKPRSASPVLGDVMAATQSGGYKDYLNWILSLGKGAVDGYSKIIKSFKKDKTPM